MVRNYLTTNQWLVYNSKKGEKMEKEQLINSLYAIRGGLSIISQNNDDIIVCENKIAEKEKEKMLEIFKQKYSKLFK